MIEDVGGVLVPRSALEPARGRQTRLDGCVVPTSTLAGVLEEYIEKLARKTAVALPGSQDGTQTGRRRKTAPAIEWLAERTKRYDPSGRGVAPTIIERIMSEKGRDRGKLTQLRTADVLMTTIGAAPFVYEDNGGPLPIRENPKASPAARAACCAGSRVALQSLTG